MALFLSPASVFAACTVTTTDPAFGTYDPLRATPTTTKSGTITVGCDIRTQNITVVIGPTPAPSSGFNPRQMKNVAGDTLTYNLYTDGTYTVIYGDGTGGTATIIFPNIQAGQSRSKTLFGSIPALQDIAAGAYTDNLVVTVTY